MARALPILLCLLALLAPLASAQEGAGTDSANVTDLELATWLWQNDWKSGIALGLTGLIGALITMYFLIGGTIPGTEGAKYLRSAEARLTAYYDTLDVLMRNAGRGNAELLEKVAGAINDLRDDIRKEKMAQYWTAFAVFILAGAGFALLFADTLLDALLMGGGWSGFLGAVSLRKGAGRPHAEVEGSRKEGSPSPPFSGDAEVPALQALRGRGKARFLRVRVKDGSAAPATPVGAALDAAQK